MLSVFICEDESNLLEGYRRIVENAIMIHDLDMRLAMATTDPEDILRLIEKGPLPQSLFFMDIDLGQKNGIDAAKTIRDNDPTAQIVFLTSHQELALETIQRQITPLNYLIKGTNDKEQIESILIERNNHLTFIDNEDLSVYFQFQVGSKEIKINIEKIYYFETSLTPHKVILYGKSPSDLFYGKLNKIENDYPMFFRANKAYLINPRNIIGVDYHKREIYFPEEYVCTYTITKAKMLKKVWKK